MKTLSLIISIITFSFLLNSCNKDSNNPTNNASYPYSIRMTDAPGPYDAVYIDLQSVEVTGAQGETVVLNVFPGIYNLLNFSNGLDTLIATGTLNIASVEQIRLILGSNNTVVVNGVTHPLSTPSAEQSGLKLQVHQTLQAGVMYHVLLDFDAYKSIVETGNGTYKLKPVIRTIETAISGAVKGSITPAGMSAFVTATSLGLSYTAAVAANGYYLLRGLPAGMYTVEITPALPYLPVVIQNVSVNIGLTTDLGVMAL